MKKYSLHFWVTFWLIAFTFLIGWFFYWQLKNNSQYNTLLNLGKSLVFTHGETKTYLVLFQNNLEIRPGGGFLGAFGIVKLRNGKLISLDSHDLSNFDKLIPNTIEPPYPMKEIGYVDFWKMRDSNFSPDFETNAKKAIEFYHLGQGKEQFDGVIGITANTLTSMLKATGPIQIEGYPGTYDSENAIIALEYQVEKAFAEQGIEKVERKDIIKALAQEIEKKVTDLTLGQKIRLAGILIDDLNTKNIQMYFADDAMEKNAQKANWAGSLDQNWKEDYLMTVDANLGAFKSDYYVKRSIDYTVDLSKENLSADLKITYEHTATQKDWMTRNYLTYLRVYVPEGATFIGGENFDDVRSGNELGKSFFGAIVRVPIESSKTVEINYTLPKNISRDNYSIKIQKQAGITDEPVTVHVIDKNGVKNDYVLKMDKDIVLSDLK